MGFFEFQAFHDSPLALFTTEDGPNDILDEIPRTKIVIQEVMRNVVRMKKAAFDLVNERILSLKKPLLTL